jgi:hypothetical protein
LNSDSKPKPLDQKEMRKFGWSLGLLIGVVFGAVLPFIFGYTHPLWPWVLAAGLALTAEVQPNYLLVVHKRWFQLADILGAIFNPIMLGMIFFGLVLPIGWTKRTLGKSKIKTKLDREVISYRDPITLSEDSRDPF